MNLVFTDEMNLFAPQSIQAKVELLMLSNLLNNVISPKDSSPVISLVQDTPIGLYYLSQEKELKWNDVTLLLSTTSKLDEILNGEIEYEKRSYSGNELISLFLPDGMNLKFGDIEIKNGKIKEGSILTGDIFKGKKGNILHYLSTAYDNAMYIEFVDNMQRISNMYLYVFHGFTIGINDFRVDEKINDVLIKERFQKVFEVENLLTNVEDNKIIDRETYEQIAYRELDSIKTNQASYVKERLTEKNNMHVMASLAKSKGKDSNIGFTMTCLGQCAFEGKLVQYTTNSRTLPYFSKNDDTPASRGFIFNNYSSGLKVSEFFYHNLDGRQGIIDTAIKSVVGDTELLIMENKEMKYIKIGDWIDKLLEDNISEINLDNSKNEYREELSLSKKTFISTTDLDGNVSWGEITGITRHLPTEEMYEIETHGGRKVCVTDSHSLLIWNDEKQKLERLSPSVVKEGSFVPVTCNLNNTPIINKYIDLQYLFPKNEYIHGTDFLKAKDLVLDILKTNKKMPAGWWNKNNGTTFHLPYTKVQLFLRTLKRSNNTMIKKNCIYPYGANKNGSIIYDKFEFTEDNGLFLGLYIAEGNSCISSGYVSITNTNDEIIDFIKYWFEKHNIKWYIEDKINKIGGHSKSIRGYSKLLAKILINIVGYKAKNKFIHPQCLSANKDFLKSLINGIVSGDGTITKTSIQITSASNRLIVDINNCLNILNIFGKMTITKLKQNNLGTINICNINMLSIRSQWALNFKNEISLICKYKQDKLKLLKPTDIHINFSKHNDIVLDKIISIRKKNGSEYKKVYDLTVPSTLNFGLANGLHVVDTGDTGYVQRKIIKSAEDIYVAYDNTLRNGVDEIVQFVYAGNGFDVVSLVETKCNLLRMNTKDLKKKYKEKKVLEYVLSLRSELLSIIFASNTDRRYIPEKFMIPFNLFHILSSCKSEKTSKYTATEIIDKIQKTLNPFDTKISAISKDDMMKYENINHYYLIMKFLLIDHLDLSKSHNKVYIDNVLEKIQYNIYKNIIQPGEMVGITSAQSIGEPLTQFTLNSVEWNTELLLKINGKLKVVKIGEWIDERIDNASKENLEYHKNDQTLEYIKDCKVEVLSADENGKVIWDNISAVTKHPVINKDKSRTLVKVTTDSGRVITATKGDSFLIRQNNKLMKYKGEDLKIGDYIPVANVFPSSNIKEWDFEEYIPKDEYVYMSEVNKALELKEKTKFWWSKHHKKDFVLPFKRGDTFYDACKIKYLNQNKKEYFQNKIYPKHGTIQSGHIPERFELDNLFGFFLGAYLAEGHCTQYQVLISNCDNDYMDRIIMFCDQHSLKYHFDEGTRPKGYSRTIRIHSLILAQLFMKACGKTSDEKHVPTELLDANEDFLKGLMDGYISGDGYVSNNITASSISKSLLDDIQVILIRFGIFSKIVSQPKVLEYNLKRGMRARLSYQMSLTKADSICFRNHFTLTIKKKQEKLNEIKTKEEFSFKDMIPDIETEQFGKITIKRSELYSYIEKCNNQNDLQILENIKNENIKYDMIVNIEEVVSDHFYVYDVTADKTKNFCTGRMSVILNDTFHSTGSSSAVGGMDGIKRFLEIINITKNQKVPITTIYMTEEYRYEKKNAEILSKKLKYVKFEDLIESYDIIYDETKERMKQDKIAEDTKLFLDKNIKASNINPYTFRMVLSKESLYDENVELIDIKLAILKFFEEFNLKITKKRYKTLFANLENVLILSNSIHDEEIIIHVRLKINEDNVDLETLKIIFDIFLKEIHIKGLPGIELVTFEDRKIHELDASENIVEKTEYVILTKGINLNELFLLHGIDKQRTITNDIQITYRYYGIEAARQLFIKEIMKVFEMGGHSLNQHHLTIIGDLVTKNGILTSVNRYGLNKLDNDPLSKASFEQTMTELIKASIYEDKDYLRSVSSRIMTGKTIKGGTGLIDIILDIDKLQSINFDKSNSNYPKDIEIVSDSENDSDSDDESGKFVESDVFKNL